MATSQRRQNYISQSRDDAIAFIDLYNHLLKLQAEWGKEQYSTTMIDGNESADPPGDFRGENEELTVADINELINSAVTNLTIHWNTYGEVYTALLK